MRIRKAGSIRRSVIRAAGFASVFIGLVIASSCKYVKAKPDVAFLGDSITQGWSYPKANFGKYGNTTAQMLERMPQVIDRSRFVTVVVLGGTNDVLLGIDPNVTIANLETLGLKIQQSGEAPVLCEIPPIFHNYVQTDKQDYFDRVQQLNKRIAELSNRHGWKLVDYYHPLLGHPDYSSDGVHMKRRGYLIMELALLHTLPDA